MSKYHSIEPDRWWLELFTTMEDTRDKIGLPMEQIYHICDSALIALQNQTFILIIKTRGLLSNEIKSPDDLRSWTIKMLTEKAQKLTDGSDKEKIIIVEPETE